MYFNQKINLLRKGLLKEEPLANKSFLIKAVIFFSFIFQSCSSGFIPYLSELPQAEKSIEKSVDVNDSTLSDLSQAEKSIKKLVNVNDSTGYVLSEGTGFFISEKHFVTNLHVILNNESILSAEPIDELVHYIHQKESSEYLKVKKVLHISAIYDFALLEIETEVSNYLKLGELEKQEELHVFGYPGGEFKRMIKEKEYPIQLEGSIYFFPVNHFDLFGASGSPVLNNQGEVVGLLSEGSGNLIIATQPDILKDLIEGDMGSSCLDFIDIKSCINKEVKNLKNKSEQGHVLAQYKLARGYLEDKEIEKSQEKAFYWYQASAEKGYALAQYQLARMYYEGKGIEKSKEEAIYWAQTSAEQGNVVAQSLLAGMYYKGEGIKENKEKAFYWYQASAEKGYALAQYQLAGMYYEGEGIEESKEEAIYWAQASLEQGSALAQSLLVGLYYEEGLIEEAFYWAQAFANQGSAQAQYQLARMYYEGKGIEKSKEEAFYWAQTSANQNDAQAQYLLAWMYYEEGLIEKAFYWNQASAKQGYAQAQYLLAWMYYTGEGIEESKEEAIYWAQASAKQGFDKAQDLLAEFAFLSKLESLN